MLYKNIRKLFSCISVLVVLSVLTGCSCFTSMPGSSGDEYKLSPVLQKDIEKTGIEDTSYDRDSSMAPFNSETNSKRAKPTPAIEPVKEPKSINQSKVNEGSSQDKKAISQSNIDSKHDSKDSSNAPSDSTPVNKPPIAPTKDKKNIDGDKSDPLNTKDESSKEGDSETMPSSKGGASGKPKLGDHNKTPKHQKKKSGTESKLPSYLAPQECKKGEVQQEGLASGTGFFVNGDGVLLTNEHVIRSADELLVYINDVLVRASVLGSSVESDIAALKIDLKTPYITFSEKDIRKGQEVVTLGYPNLTIQGADLKATFGYINSLEGIRGDKRYMQFSAQIQPGNSGSPVVNAAGEIIGVATLTLNQSYMMAATGSFAQNVNYGLNKIHVKEFLNNSDIPFTESTKERKQKMDLVDDLSDAIVLIIAKRHGEVLICKPKENTEKSKITKDKPKKSVPDKKEAIPQDTIKKTRPDKFGGQPDPKLDEATDNKFISETESRSISIESENEDGLGSKPITSESESKKPTRALPEWHIFR